MSEFVQRPPSIGDAWASDGILRRSLSWHQGDDLFARAEQQLAVMGTWATSPETLALVLKAEREPPAHVPYSPWGERVDDIRVSDAYVALGKVGVEAGVTSLPYEYTPYKERARVVWAG